MIVSCRVISASNTQLYLVIVVKRIFACTVLLGLEELGVRGFHFTEITMVVLL